MKNFTVMQALEACGGRLNSGSCEDRTLGRIVIDSRAVMPGDLFAAYRGENTDGHAYIGAAFERGAACCLAERLPDGETRPVILVPDVQKALERIAAAYRRSLDLPVIGITGSVGKTSAKEMIAAVLGQRWNVLKTEGNLNNQIGVPMTVSRIEPEHEAAVVEMGISDFGEMTLLADIVRPCAAVFTVIGHAHLEKLRDLEGVLRAKTELLPFLPADGTVIVNGDDPLLRGLRCPQRLLRFGFGADCDVRAEEVCADGEGVCCTLVYGDSRFPVRIPAFGQHMVRAALAGAAVGFAMGLTEAEIAAGIACFRAVGRRMAVTETGLVTLIDDSYNANPDSIASGLDSLMSLPGRHVAILGDMLELGENSPALHREVGRLAREKGLDALWVSGPLSGCYAEGAGDIARRFESVEALLAALPELLQRGDAVLVKASRGMHFETVAEAVKKL